MARCSGHCQGPLLGLVLVGLSVPSGQLPLLSLHAAQSGQAVRVLCMARGSVALFLLTLPSGTCSRSAGLLPFAVRTRSLFFLGVVCTVNLLAS